MGDVEPRAETAAPALADGDSRYKAVQAKLSKLSRAMDDAARRLEAVQRSMRKNASHAEGVAVDIAHAGLDPKFVGLTTNVADALGYASREVRTLAGVAQETADLAHQARRTHSTLYGGLDDIRSNRREKTPKPGFFNR